MAQPLSYEDKDTTFFITSKTQGDKLWFINNPTLENAVLAYLAKYQEVYGVILYAFIIMGNHYHLIAKFPNCNKAQFMRSFNSMFAKLTREHVAQLDIGKVWARRYAWQVLPRPEDIQHWALYCALNPVTSGLCKNPQEYKGYNSFDDARNGIIRKFKVFERKKFNDLYRYPGNLHIKREDYTKEYNLVFSQLPGICEMGLVKGRKYLSDLHEAERLRYISERKLKGEGFATTDLLLRTKVGKKPKKSKKSDRFSFRPLVLTLCIQAKKTFFDFYFSLRESFLEASLAFREGRKNVDFPPGTYPPSLVAVV